MQATVTWQDNLTFVCETDQGHKVILDGDATPLSPIENLLLSAGACSSIDVVMIMQKARQAISDCRCELKAKRAEEAPRVFTDIHLHFVVEGEALSEKQLKRAIDLSVEKYCSVLLMLSGNVNVTHSYSLAG